MPSIDEHCKESLRLFGKLYTDVHLWLDALTGSPECGMRHKMKRHRLAGIVQMRRIFGDDAIEPAKQHIISDLKMEG